MFELCRWPSPPGYHGAPHRLGEVTYSNPAPSSPVQSRTAQHSTEQHNRAEQTEVEYGRYHT